MIGKQISAMHNFYSEYYNSIIFEEFHNHDYEYEHIDTKEYLSQINTAYNLVKEFYENHYEIKPTEEECIEGVSFLESEYNSKKLSYIIIGKFLDEFIFVYRIMNCINNKYPKYEVKYKDKIKEKLEKAEAEKKQKAIEEIAQQRKSYRDILIHMRNMADRESQEKEKDDDYYF